MPPHPANYSFERWPDSPPHFGNALELASVFHSDASWRHPFVQAADVTEAGWQRERSSDE